MGLSGVVVSAADTFGIYFLYPEVTRLRLKMECFIIFLPGQISNDTENLRKYPTNNPPLRNQSPANRVCALRRDKHVRNKHNYYH